MLLSLDNVTFGYDGNPNLENVTLTVNEGERIGFVGGNGEGKTTLLKLILGEITPDDGSVFKKNGIRIGYLAQTGGFYSDATVYDAMKEVFREDEELIARLGDTQKCMANADETQFKILSAKAESLNKRIAARNSYNYEIRIKTVLGGMGFERVLTQYVNTMSGGERTKLKLCRLLLEEPELLILDEPTNHLDIKTLFWLEDYLSSYKGAILVVSHDRYFLDKLTSRTWELERGKVTSYKGNYSKYKILKDERLKEQTRAYEKQQEEIAKLQDYVDRNIVRATTAKSALSRVNKLERMDVLEKPNPPPKPPRFCFVTEERPYERVLLAEHFDLEAGEKTLLFNVCMTVMRGEKCAIVGDNGTGKSTLLKFLLSGDKRVNFGRYVKTAYYDQENADLDPEERTLDAFWGRHTLMSQTDVRNLLAQAGLGADDIDKKVKELSGGMRAKLELAILEAKKGNFLILDEPTNHLDLLSRESLEEALRAYDGTLLFVSHDRRFIERIATAIFTLENGKLTYFKGSYGDYLEARKRASVPTPVAETKPKKTEGYRSKEDRAREAQARNRVREIEIALEKLEAEEAEINEQMIKFATDYKKIVELSARVEEIHTLADALYAEYETLI